MPRPGRDENGAAEHAARDRADGAANVAKGVATLPSPVGSPQPSASSWVTVAENSEDRRAFLQERIALFAKTVSIISFSFFCVSAVSFLVLADRAPISIFGWESCWHLASIGVLVIVWILTRSTKLGDSALDKVDAIGTLLTCTAYGIMVLRTHDTPGALIAVLPTLSTLVTRAVLIPSAPRRTMVLSVVAFLPSVVVSFLLGTTVFRTVPHATASTIYVASWGAAAVAISTITSRIIYGLEQKVREARQLGQYTLAERIGAGGMGVVYRATHAMLRRPTAVKVLPPDKMGEQNLRRFEREVQLTSQLTHPNTISIYDFGRTADGLFYYAMEYLEGFTLAELVEVGGPLPPARVAALMRQVSGSIREAHQIGLIHRDIKPDNIVVCERGGMCDVVKVLDFGLVKDIRAASDPSLSQVNAIIGTPHYMSPESISSPSSVGVPSDIYSMGATAYFILVGRHVFQARTLVEIASHHLMTPPEPPSAALGHAVLPALERVILDCLAKKPADRPAGADVLENTYTSIGETERWSQETARAWWRDHRDALLRLKASRASKAPPTGNSAVLRSATFASKMVAPTG